MNRRTFAVVLILVLGLAASASLPAADRTTVLGGIDLWSTRADGMTFVDFKTTPIPSGFFCAGSAPFTGKILLKGAPIAAGRGFDLGRTDTIVQRLDDAVFNKQGRATTRVQVQALNLVGMAPVMTSCGAFNVRTALDGPQPITRMRLVRQNPKGGTFVAPLALNIKLLFTPVDRPDARPLALRQSFAFNGNPVEPWTMERLASQAVVHEDFVKVDTDGDGRLDMILPGTSNFNAGFGSRQKYLTDCHFYTDADGVIKRHCYGMVEP
ncbi:MAG: hypothetical protein ACJ75H_09380 [Thermoanaerobaculia bacterium]